MDVVNDASEGGEGRERGSTKHKAVKRLKRIYKGSLTHSLDSQTACLLVPRMLVVEFLHPTICSKEREKQNILEHAISIPMTIHASWN